MGFVNAGTIALSSMVSLAMSFVLLLDYLPFQFSYTEDILLRFLFSMVVSVINVLGVEWISQLSTYLLVFIFSPFVAALGLVLLYHKEEVEELFFYKA